MDADVFIGRIGYVVADLKRIGPTNQTLSIIRYSGAVKNCVVFTLFEESGDTLIEEYKSFGIRIVCLNLSRKTVLIKGANTLRKALLEEKVCIAHSWGTYADIVTYYAIKRLDVNHIITLRNFPVEEMTTRMNYAVGMCVAKLDLHILKNCRNVIACSNSIKKKMEDTYHWTHIKSIQNGVDFNKFERGDRVALREKLGVPDKDIIFISTSSIIPRKRINETAEAFLQAKKNHHMQLWFFGDGSLLDEMRGKYEHGGIRFWGKQDSVTEFLSVADVFVSSSESEGLPNAVLEAVACEVPVYLSDIPQHLEILESIPGCGKSYELGNIGKLSELIESTDAATLIPLREATMYLRSSELTMENMGKKYQCVYKSLERKGQ